MYTRRLCVFAYEIRWLIACDYFRFIICFSSSKIISSFFLPVPPICFMPGDSQYNKQALIQIWIVFKYSHLIQFHWNATALFVTIVGTNECDRLHFRTFNHCEESPSQFPGNIKFNYSMFFLCIHSICKWNTICIDCRCKWQSFDYYQFVCGYIPFVLLFTI